jgi:Tfp pilus assembly protein PilF
MASFARKDIRMRLIASISIALHLVSATAAAAPFLPASDREVLERLPFARRDPAMQELEGLQAQLREDPNNLPVAARLARGFLELSRSAGDPRYVGYAQAALAPWWSDPHPPLEVLTLRATARQRVHQFDAALADLDAAIALDPRNAQAHLTRATVLQVTGAFGPALQSCARLSGASLRLARTACLANAAGAIGRLRQSYEDLVGVLAQSPSVAPALRAWVGAALGEMAARLGDAAAAERHFRAALLDQPDDPYLLGAYADLLLDERRPAEVETLLKGKERIDPLLLRLALAARLAGADALAERVAQLRERFEASRLRGDAAHQREEARFALHLESDAARALWLARENWRVQKEPADLRILIEAAQVTGDESAMRDARAFLEATRLEDARLDKINSKAAQPN